MKLQLLLFGVFSVTNTLLAGSLPVITTQPQSANVAFGGNATMSITATGATSYQWRFNGTDLAGATNSTLEFTYSFLPGYYMVVVKNDTGWVPSQMAWLSTVSGFGGTVPFSNIGNNYFAGQASDYFNTPLNNCSARVVAGPALDQMKPIFPSIAVTNGYYGNSSLTRTVPTVAPGQTVYYRVDISPTSPFNAQSTVLKLTAGGGSFSTPSVYGLKFPGWWVGEGLEPSGGSNTPTNQVRIPGETFSLTNTYFAYLDYGTPKAEWRKNGNPIVGATNFPAIEYYPPYDGIFQSVLTITNVQAADAGVYDLAVFGNNWFIGPKTSVSVQLVNGRGVFQAPRLSGSYFVCDLVGAPTRNYAIEWSSNLFSWSNLLTLSNSTGTVTFSNSLDAASSKFFRARLLP